MSCRPCSIIRTVILNVAISLDRTSNALLLGSPNETLSQRTARARAAGQSWATAACAALTWLSRNLFSQTADHCTWSLEPGTSGVEVWPWSPVVTAAEQLAPSSTRK